MTGRKTAFRFYPQCEPCSNQQGSVVKQWKSTLKTHFRSVRPYHFTGMWLVLFCTGGLYVGGSDFHGALPPYSHYALTSVSYAYESLTLWL